MKKVGVFYIVAILMCIGCDNSTTTREMIEIADVVEDFRLSPLIVSIDNLHEGKITDMSGVKREVAYVLSANCKFSYDLTKIDFDKETRTITLPTCEVSISQDLSTDKSEYFYIGGEYHYELEKKNELKQEAIAAIYEKLIDAGYEDKAFQYAQKLLTNFLKNFGNQEVSIKKNKKPISPRK